MNNRRMTYAFPNVICVFPEFKKNRGNILVAFPLFSLVLRFGFDQRLPLVPTHASRIPVVGTIPIRVRLHHVIGRRYYG